MKNIMIIGTLMIFLLSCQQVKIIRKSDINADYRETVFKNPSVKNAIQDIASNFGKREASVIVADDLIIVRAPKYRISRVEEFFNVLK